MTASSWRADLRFADALAHEVNDEIDALAPWASRHRVSRRTPYAARAMMPLLCVMPIWWYIGGVSWSA